jgi:hypothetical protein
MRPIVLIFAVFIFQLSYQGAVEQQRGRQASPTSRLAAPPMLEHFIQLLGAA